MKYDNSEPVVWYYCIFQLATLAPAYKSFLHHCNSSVLLCKWCWSAISSDTEWSDCLYPADLVLFTNTYIQTTNRQTFQVLSCPRHSWPKSEKSKAAFSHHQDTKWLQISIRASPVAVDSTLFGSKQAGSLSECRKVRRQHGLRNKWEEMKSAMNQMKRRTFKAEDMKWENLMNRWR